VEKRQRGRPAQDRAALKEKVLTVATGILIEEDFSRFSIDAVAKSGGIAKKTIYSFVANRDELVGEIVSSWTSRLSEEGYETLWPAASEQWSSPLKALLFRIYRTALSKEAISLFRMITSDRDTRTQLAATYNRNGVEKAVVTLSKLLMSYVSVEMAAKPDVEAISRAMLAWLVGEPLRRAALGLEMPYDLSDAEVKKRVAACVALYEPVLVSSLRLDPARI
jgi:AcrR family transcriptional regulator